MKKKKMSSRETPESRIIDETDDRGRHKVDADELNFYIISVVVLSF
jgi:hypothetical protein